MSPRRKVIVNAHLGPVPIFRERSQPAAKAGGLPQPNAAPGEVDRLLGPNQRHNDARAFGIIQWLD
jgi:hypothetical protein